MVINLNRCYNKYVCGSILFFMNPLSGMEDKMEKTGNEKDTQQAIQTAAQETRNANSRTIFKNVLWSLLMKMKLPVDEALG